MNDMRALAVSLGLLLFAVDPAFARALDADLSGTITNQTGGTVQHAVITVVSLENGRVRTVHFSDRIEEGKMVFDYRLKEGVVETTNAIRLMKVVGIDVAFAADP